MVLPFGYLIHRRPGAKNLALKNMLVWSFAAFFGLVFAGNAIFALTGVAPDPEFVLTLPRVTATGFVNLAAYLIIISAVFEYREIVAMLRREFARLEVVRETIAGHLAELKARYLAEVQGKIAPVLADITSALEQANAGEVMDRARTAINEVVLPLSSNISTGVLHEAMQELPALPTGRLRVRIRQIFDAKVELAQAFMPLVTAVVFLASIVPAFVYFYSNSGFIAAGVTLAFILIGQFVTALLVRNRKFSILPALLMILISSSLVATAAGQSIYFFVSGATPEVNAFLAFGTWLIVALSSLLLTVNSLTANYLQKLSDVQDEFARSLQKRDFEIRQLQSRITTAIHNDVQGKLRVVLLRVRTGGLSSENLVALEADLAHVRNSLAEIDATHAADFYGQLRALQEFWAGVCSIKLTDDLDVAELLETNNQVAAKAFDVISEATANAVKHAEAELVEVQLSIDGNRLAITVANSLEKGLVSNPSSGVGGRIFDELSDSWQIRNNESRYELTVFLNFS